MNRKDYCVIGLGRFGTEVARILQLENQKLLVVDDSEEIIESKGNDFDQAMVLDGCNIHELSDIGIKEYDKVIVAVSDFEKSITICSNLRELGVKNIIARAGSLIHQRILKSMGVARVIIPEIDVASKITYQSIYGINIDIFSFDNNSTQTSKLSEKCFIVEVPIGNSALWKKQISEINLPKHISFTIIAVKRTTGELLIAVKGNDVINRGDRLYIITMNKHIKEIFNYFQS